VLPSFPRRVASIDPFWITAGGLSRALGARLGGSEVLAPYGVLRPEDVEEHAVRWAKETGAAREGFRHLPQPARIALGDLRALGRARRMRRLARVVAGRSYRLVVQLHRRFHDCGFAVARAAGIPIVLRVDALEVEEEATWGLRRPGWGRVVEELGELRLIRRADMVAPVSEAVDAQLARAGIDPERRVVVPSGVDLGVFQPGEPDVEMRRKHGLDGRLVVGWVGGFRPFHGLDAVPAIARGLRERVPDAVLCLVGAGPLREEIATRVRGLEDVVRLIDPVPYREVPRWIRSFDVCLLLAGGGPFHYSPLKLYEYLACGRSVVAPRVGEVASVLADGREGILVPSGDAGAVVSAVERLAADPQARAKLGAEGRRTAERTGSWKARADHLFDALEARGLLTQTAT
jgi:glycosyltransferase involved in cell wall biosynthesis